MIKRLIAYIGLLVLLVLLLLTQTRFGLQLLLDLGQPFGLEATAYSGSLFKAPVIINLHWADQLTTIDVDSIALDWELQSFRPLTLNIKTLSIDRLQILSTQPADPLYVLNQLQIKGIWSLKTEFNHLALSWQGMSIPISPSFYIKLPKGKAKTLGPLDHYQISATFLSDGHYFPQGQWHLNGTEGSLEGLKEFNLRAKLKHLPPLPSHNTFLGSINVSGKVHWVLPITWQAILKTSHLQLNSLAPQLTGFLNIGLQSQGEMNETTSHINLFLNQLSGLLNHQPLTGQGQFRIQGLQTGNTASHQFYLNHIILRSGSSLLQVSGQLTPPQNHLNFKLSLPNLSTFVPDWQGSIQGEGEWNEQHNLKNLQSNWQIQHLHFLQTHIQALNLNTQLYSNLDRLSQLELTGTNIQAYGLILNNLALNIKNLSNQNQAHLLWQGPKIKGELRTLGRIQNKDWLGQISQVNVALNDFGAVHLNHPIHLRVGANAIVSSPFCLQSKIGSTCIQQFALKRLTKGLDNIPYVDGTLTVQNQDLSFLPLFIPSITQTKGLLKATLNVSGEVKHPQFRGQVNLDKGEANIAPLGLKLRNIQAHILATQSSLDYQGQLSSDPGRLEFSGHSDLNAPSFASTARIDSEQPLQIMNTADIRLYAIPHLNLHFSNPLLTLEGKIIFPKGHISPRDLSTSVTLSKDVIFVDEPKKQTQTPPFKLQSHILVEIGPNVSLSYAGLTGELEGNLALHDQSDQDTTASGTIHLNQGKFDAYGQKLNIRQGKLLFTGGLITNPGLSIQAVKTLQVVSTTTTDTATVHQNQQQVVGVQVTGTAEQPNTRLFSEPSGLSQADILSYLVVGRPSNQINTKQSANLASALSLLGGLGSKGENGSLTGHLSQALGLSQFSIGNNQTYDKNSGETIQNTSVNVGKSVSPRLNISYSFGLVEPINTLQMVYQLTQRFRLQSEHSTNANGIDLYYTIERK